MIEAPVERAELDDGVDVVTSFEVLEHLFSPRAFLEQCAALLRPGGRLIVTCPNVRGFDVETLGEPSATVDAEHLNYLHPASLGALLERCGFEVEEAVTPGAWTPSWCASGRLRGSSSCRPAVAAARADRRVGPPGDRSRTSWPRTAFFEHVDRAARRA